MHEIYARVFRREYADHAATTREAVKSIYNSLPEPEKLNSEWVRGLLERLRPSSRVTYLSHIRKLESELGPILQDIPSPKVPKTTIEAKDLYSKEELDEFWKACTDTRDRALFMVLYESGIRRFELHRLDFSSIRPAKNLWWLSIMGKGAKARTVPILHAVEALQAWLNVHPVGKGAVFTRLRVPFTRLSYNGLYERTVTILKRAGVKRRNRPIHLFRHTRATELAGMGMSEAELCQFFGWEIGSPEARTYVHLSGRDLQRSMGRLYGLEVEQEEPILKMESVRCARCGKVNAPQARFCSQCSFVLDEEMALRMQRLDDEDMIRKIIREELGVSDGEE